MHLNASSQLAIVSNHRSGAETRYKLERCGRLAAVIWRGVTIASAPLLTIRHVR